MSYPSLIGTRLQCEVEGCCRPFEAHKFISVNFMYCKEHNLIYLLKRNVDLMRAAGQLRLASIRIPVK